MADSYRLRILNYLRDTTLAAITTGNGYNTSPGQIKRGLREIDAYPDSDFPIILIGEADEARENITRSQFKSTMSVAIVGYVTLTGDPDGLQAHLDNLIEDIAKAVEQDRTLGGLSKWLEVKNIIGDNGDTEPRAACGVLVDVIYVSEGVTP